MLGFHNILEKVYRDDVASQAKAVEQLHQFRSMQGVFGRPAALLTRKTLGPHAWWSIYGSCTPELQKMAIQVLSQVQALHALYAHDLCTNLLARVDSPTEEVILDAGDISLCMREDLVDLWLHSQQVEEPPDSRQSREAGLHIQQSALLEASTQDWF